MKNYQNESDTISSNSLRILSSCTFAIWQIGKNMKMVLDRLLVDDYISQMEIFTNRILLQAMSAINSVNSMKIIKYLDSKVSQYRECDLKLESTL